MGKIMSITVSSQKEVTSTNAATPVKQTTQAKQIFSTKPVQLSSAKKEAANNLKCRILNLLDLEDNFLNVSFLKKEDGIMYLKLTRPADDKRRPEMRREFSNGAIKEKLGLKDNVLRDNNNLKDVTGRPNLDESSGATIEPGKSMLIPLSKLGENFKWYHFGKNDIKDYVQKFLDAE